MWVFDKGIEDKASFSKGPIARLCRKGEEKCFGDSEFMSWRRYVSLHGDFQVVIITSPTEKHTEEGCDSATSRLAKS